MNISEVITRLKLQLGLLNIATVFEDLDGTLTDIVLTQTLPVFSTYNPYRDYLHINTHDLEQVHKDAVKETYLLPEMPNRKLLYVLDVTYETDSIAGVGYYGGGMPLLQGNSITQLMLANAGASVMNTVIPKITFKFEHPRMLSLYNIYHSCKIVIYMGFEHDKSLASIPDTARESFMKLSELDCKKFLYPTMKQYNEIQSPIGNINLKIDEWANADEQRESLLNDWDDKYHLDFPPFYWI